MDLRNIKVVIDGYAVDNSLKKRYELKGCYLIPLNSISNIAFKRDFINLLKRYRVQEV